MRLRITFSKTGTLRYTGHLDLQTVWERTARRAGLSLAYTQGFHPGPKIQIASALPLGIAGKAEIVDLWLDTDPGPAAGTQRRLQAGAPPGLTILQVETVDEHGPALQTQVVSAEYMVTLLEAPSGTDLQQRLDNILGASTLLRTRRDKPYDLRPLIEELTLTPTSIAAKEGQAMQIFMRLAARDGATGRPEELLDALGLPLETTRIERTRLILKTGME
ncbi:MAG: TIGR03936 family radical SAM-associated protein [Anaerolineales bacterium]|jgi:radical SAM-linked protein